MTCAACLDWSIREDIQTGTVRGRLSWTGRRYLAGTVRGRPSWFSTLLPEVQGTPSWFTGLELKQHEDQAQRIKSRVQAQNDEVQNGSSVDQVQRTRAVIEREANAISEA
ncbi:golgin subfamily B member 1 [Dorcoceras hygrometricum]|uniref:Golgin subfamily B member 1 n=1 Tax=Dorcoceras hygrometricum TaxID=472368 RepID=A0A2Z7AN42_9LAMI|nr:golgin subfamily B member 1 [Dorcoceras hygrometricum]